MSDYFFGRFSDLVDPITEQDQVEKAVRIDDTPDEEIKVERKRVKEVKANFLNKYIYSAFAILILLIVAIFYFVSR